MYESTSKRREGLVELTMRSNLLSDRDWRVTNFLNNKPLIIFYQYTSNTYNISVKFMSDMFISVLVGYGVAVDLSFLFLFHLFMSYIQRPRYNSPNLK